MVYNPSIENKLRRIKMTEKEFEELIELYAGINVNIALSNATDVKPTYTYDDLEKAHKQIMEVFRCLK